MGDQQHHQEEQHELQQQQIQLQQIDSGDNDPNRMKRVILIRLPPGAQNQTTANSSTSPIPPNLITHIVNNELKQHSNLTTITINNNNDPSKMPANTSTNSGDATTPTTPTSTAAATAQTTTSDGAKKKNKRGDDVVNYKNYSPKQREWMLVYLGYARGLLGKEFEEKLPDAIIQKTNDILIRRGRFCNINRVPSSKTLRAVWKNLWKEERTVATIIKKGGRPRIDPTIKREKRNERERRKRAAARELKEARKLEAERSRTDMEID